MAFIRIDHVMVCVPDLDRGTDTYSRLGFSVHRGGAHPDIGTHNAISFFEDDYLELLAIRDADEFKRNNPWKGIAELVARGGGLRYIVPQSDNLEADINAMRLRGVDIGKIYEGKRLHPDGRVLRWKGAALGPRHSLPMFFIEHITPVADRRPQLVLPHPNSVHRIERAHIAVTDLASAAREYERVLNQKPKMERGTVIMADMAIFQLGASAIVLAQPYAAGVTADALARNGAGPFQLLFRTKNMGAAAKWMAEHGVPPPARVTRNTGEQAMLIPPEQASGVYIGFFGPP